MGPAHLSRLEPDPIVGSNRSLIIVELRTGRVAWHFSGEVWEFSRDGRLVADPDRFTRFPALPSLGAWPPTALRDGKIKYLDNTSGHYDPKGAAAQQAAEEAFSKAGFEVEGKFTEKVFDSQKGWIPVGAS